MKNQGGDTKAAPRPAAKTSGALGEEGDPSEPTAALEGGGGGARPGTGRGAAVLAPLLYEGGPFCPTV